MFRTTLISALLISASLGAAAQSTLYFREGQRVDPQQVQRILDNVPGRTRSIRMLGDVAEASAAATASTLAPTALSLPVQFEFDSATISAAAREQLDSLAQGIKLLPAERQVVIEGHTDARGSDDYNEQLSLRRASAVKQYLVQEHGIAAARLHGTGLGKRQPVAEADPYAAANRRVQFRGS